MISTTPEANRLDLFSSASVNEPLNITDGSEPNAFSILGVLSLNGHPMVSWWDITMSIFLWICISYSLIFIGGAFVALLFMRKHPYVFLWVTPMLAMCVIGPCTVGFLTSSSLAFALQSASKPVSPWHSMVFGVSQSMIVVLISFSRLLGTL